MHLCSAQHTLPKAVFFQPAPPRAGEKGHYRAHLIAKIAEGRASFTEIQEDAAAAHSDGIAVDISELGCAGKHPGNCARDFRRKVLKPLQRDLLQTYSTELPFQDPKSGALFREHAFILPHEFFSYLSLWPADFEERVCGGSTKHCVDYWATAGSSKWYTDHPGRRKIEASPHLVAPIRIYGDDAKYFPTSNESGSHGCQIHACTSTRPSDEAVELEGDSFP